MSDPYAILGVAQNASDDEVKKAYRELVRKYHPDNYHDNPLADLAQEKMKEINEAYDDIMKIREGKGGTANNSRAYNASGFSGARGRYSGGSAEGARVRSAINAGNLQLAEELLAAFAVRNAEWNFLMGSLFYRKGWLDDARGYFQTAASMEPANAEYRQALMFMNRGGQAYRPYGSNAMATGGCDACDICTAMMCLNMCCHCG